MTLENVLLPIFAAFALAEGASLLAMLIQKKAFNMLLAAAAAFSICWFSYSALLLPLLNSNYALIDIVMAGVESGEISYLAGSVVPLAASAHLIRKQGQVRKETKPAPENRPPPMAPKAPAKSTGTGFMIDNMASITFRLSDQQLDELAIILAKRQPKVPEEVKVVEEEPPLVAFE